VFAGSCPGFIEMNAIVTCGPSYEPVDKVRRLTNFSTGRLGVTLANHLALAGHRVVCLKGEQSTYAAFPDAALHHSFSTNDNLAGRLEALSRAEQFDAVFHAAALCDFQVAGVTRLDGTPVAASKIASRDGDLLLRLRPAAKVLSQLRNWFPNARIVGWKYELEGTAEAAFAHAWRQIAEARTDGCVLNGAAYGPGFAFCHAQGHVDHWNSLPELCAALRQWLESAR
jgi:phosphopantothenate---cysteine ligase (CTP)